MSFIRYEIFKMKSMIKTTTQGDLILYAFNEAGFIDGDRIQRNIDGDPLVREEFNAIIDSLHALNQVQLEPSQSSIDKILAFSIAGKA